MKYIVGKKLRMGQIFDKDGTCISVTLIEAGPCIVTQIKTKEHDDYDAIQIGFEKISEKKVKKSQKIKPFKFLKEFHGDVSKFKIGDQINVNSMFNEGDVVNIIGISKGKGYAGVVKRWGFHGRNSTRGNAKEERAPGSIGSAHPSHVIKGKKMAGRQGTQRTTVKNLKIIKIVPNANLIAIKGAVPGRKGSLIEIIQK